MYKKIYFIGIGGIGMSALARYFMSRGVEIHGYDKTETELSKSLVQEGIQIHYEDRPDLIPENIDLVVVTPAVPKELKEYEHILNLNIPVLKRSQVLGMITSDENNIAIAGTHGKTTTSVLLAHILYDNGMEISAFLGGIGVNYNSNFLDHGNQWMVEEADEYDRSFLHLHPTIAIIGSLDADHLDIYGTREQMVDHYLKFASQIKNAGLLLMSDTILFNEFKRFENQAANIRILQFGFDNEDINVAISETEKGWTTFNYIKESINMINLTIRLPGDHNIRNAAAAITVALELGLNESQIRKSLTNFKGIKRRFEWIFETEEQVLIDDYAHHPEEVKAAIAACRDAYPGRHITGIFQPHLYSRTRDFMDAFAEVLKQLDRVILIEIYPAREIEIPGISSDVLFNKIQHSDKWLSSKVQLCSLLRKIKKDVVICLGAGDIDRIMTDIKAAIFEPFDINEFA